MIGVFDSGSGGLSVLREVYKLLPDSDFLYLGDIKNAPYGERKPEELFALTVQAIRFLRSNGASSIVSACNSVSASLAVSIFDTFNLGSDSLIEMVGPTVNYFRESNGRVLLCATSATIKSGLYQQGFKMMGKEVATLAIPKLAEAIEFGFSEEIQEEIIKEAFADSVGTFDTLILGCTHYPLIKPIFKQVLGRGINIFDPAVAVAKRVEKRLKPYEKGNGNLRFVITKESPQFRARVEEFFPKDKIAVEVVECL